MNQRKLHLLSHGRNFANLDKVARLVETDVLEHMLIGVPVHGHASELHDAISGVPGSYEQTINGLLNLAYVGANLEVRIVVNSSNIVLLPEIVKRIFSVLRYSQAFIAVMQLEPAGWASNRYDDLYVQPNLQVKYLEEAANIAGVAGREIRFYNYPMCHLPSSLHSKANQSISDWKNYFPKECNQCSLKSSCCGFFKSAVRRNDLRVRPKK